MRRVKSLLYFNIHILVIIERKFSMHCELIRQKQQIWVGRNGVFTGKD